MTGVHLIIFCGERYRDVFLDNCVYCIEQHVQDRILTRTIVSPSVFDYQGFDVVDDHALWSKIDPDFNCRALFDAPWLRQQVLKLSADHLRTGNLLIVDADLFFIRPVRFVESFGYNIYTAQDYWLPSINTTNLLLDAPAHSKESYVTDFAIWNSDVLRSLRDQIAHRAQNSWLQVLARTADLETYNISEYQLYGTFLRLKYPSMVNSFIPPIGYKQDIPDRDMDLALRGQAWLESLRQQSENHYQSVLLSTMPFREFYLKVKDPQWPTCIDEKSFWTLPDYIQKECIEQHQLMTHIPSMRSYLES